jgi:hypothetical protein
MLDIHKSGVTDPPFESGTWLRFQAARSDTSNNFIAPFVQRTSGAELAICGVESHCKVLEFDPAPGLKMSVEKK